MNLKTVISFLIAALLLACNTVKKAGKRQQQFEDVINDYIVKHPPRIDTNTVYIKGKDSLIKITVPVIDSARTIEITDSLKAAYQAQNISCDEQVNRVFNTGWDMAANKFKDQKINIPAPDTIKQTIYNTDVENLLRKQVATLTGKLEQEEKHNKKTATWLWPFIISICCNAVFIYIIGSQAIKGISIFNVTKKLTKKY